MESDYLDCNDNFAGKESLHDLFPQDSSHKSDLHGDPRVNPQIGEEFQVNIPPMITGTSLFNC